MKSDFFDIDSAPIRVTKRNLPHWSLEHAIYWINFRLADSVPQEKLRVWKADRELWLKQHLEPWSDKVWREYHKRFGERFDHWLDSGYGCCALAQDEVRNVVIECLLRFDGKRLKLHAGVIMPNHVHLLLETLGEHELFQLMKGIKSASARQANKILGKSGQFWFEESYEHIVRSEVQYHHLQYYIEQNPIKTRLKPDAYWLYKS